jgi:hypothetical protein
MKMNKPLKDYITPFVPRILLTFLRKTWEKRILLKWLKDGSPIPPPHIVKQMAIEEYRKKYNYSIFIETGTYRGGMVEAQRINFKKIISIELNQELCIKAQKRFKRDSHITIIQGDSGKVLPFILKDINEPAIFWLDGHYSGGGTSKGESECPIYNELSAIFNSKMDNSILLIDDARCFIGDENYPTLEELTRYIRKNNPKYHVEIKNDILRYSV